MDVYEKYHSPFAERLRCLMLEKGITQKEIAKILRASKACVCDWYNGVSEPGAERLVKLSKIFGVTVDYLLGQSMGWVKTSNENPNLPTRGQRVIAFSNGFSGEAYVDAEGNWYRMYGVKWEDAFGSKNPVQKWMEMPGEE